jgi:uncharacterized protein YkwD
MTSCAILSTRVDDWREPIGTAEIEVEVLRLVNDYRRRRNLPPLAHDPRLSSLARIHSQAMASGERTFGHDGFESRANTARAIGIEYTRFAENVGSNNFPSREVAWRAVQTWIESFDHNENLVGNFATTGIGVALGSDGHYFLTHLFVR